MLVQESPDEHNIYFDLVMFQVHIVLVVSCPFNISILGLNMATRGGVLIWQMLHQISLKKWLIRLEYR